MQEQRAPCFLILNMIYQRLFSLTKVRTRQGVYYCFSSRLSLVVFMQSICTHCGCCTYLYHTCAMCRGRPPYAFMLPYAIPTYALAWPGWVISLRTCIYCYPSCTSYLASVAETVISRVLLYGSRTWNRRTHRVLTRLWDTVGPST